MSERSSGHPRGDAGHPGSSLKGSAIPVGCGMEGCHETTQLRFVGPSPFEAFRFDEEGWTVVEDMDDGRTVFLCPACTEAFEEEMEEEDEEEDEDEEDEEDEEAELEGPAGKGP